jgi:hypothetical protein
VPKTLVKSFCIEARSPGGDWVQVAREDNNYQRLVKIDLDVQASAIRFIPESTWGAETVHVFAWDVSE